MIRRNPLLTQIEPNLFFTLYNHRLASYQINPTQQIIKVISFIRPEKAR